jgi:hypothetical protein
MRFLSLLILIFVIQDVKSALTVYETFRPLLNEFSGATETLMKLLEESRTRKILTSNDVTHNLSLYMHGLNFSFLNDKFYKGVIVPVLKITLNQIMFITVFYITGRVREIFLFVANCC